MQTFLPYPDYEETARCLDRQRLGKQRVETMQIMSALLKGKGWINHPVTKMWYMCEGSLLRYQEAICREWTRRGYQDTCFEKTETMFLKYIYDTCWVPDDPDWLGNPEFHLAHQSNLVRKLPEHYGSLFPGVPNNLPYVYPEGIEMPNQVTETVLIEDARLMFRNFSGRAEKFNASGKRNFCVLLDDQMAAQMRADGWNVKELKAREEGDVPQPYIKVNVNYETGRPPRIVLVTSKNRQDLGSEEVMLIDAADIKKADVLISPYNYDLGEGSTGVSAYLKTAFITLNEDVLELMYANATSSQMDGE